MPAKSRKGNVTKRCDCKRPYSCPHHWFYYYGTGKGRLRGDLDVATGVHHPDLRSAQEAALRVIAALKKGQDPKGLVTGDDPTLGDLLRAYHKAKPSRDYDWQVPRICRTLVNGRPFGDWLASTVTVAAVDVFREGRPKVAGDRDFALMRAAFNMAVLKDVIPSTPFRKGGVATMHKHHEYGRTRRLQAGEYDALLAAASQDVADIIVAAVHSGMRSGEIASLQFGQVTNKLFLPAIKTKTKKDRRVPISAELQEVINRRRLDPAGDPLPPTAYVFGDEAGRYVEHRKRAWLATILRAHGHTVRYVTTHKPYRRTGNLTPECREALRMVGLHFHDLRREAGSRWMDNGVSLATIQRWLGHANISQTSTYLGASIGNDEAEMARYESLTAKKVKEPV